MDEKFVPHKRVPSKRRKRGKRKWLYQISIIDSKGKVVASYRPKIQSMRGVKNRRKADRFFQFYKCVHNFLRRDTLPALLNKFKIKPTWNGPAKLFYP